LTRPLRLLFVTDDYPPRLGGAGLTMEALAGALAEREHVVEVAAPWQPSDRPYSPQGNVRVHRLRDLTTRVPGISSDPFKRPPPPFPDPELVSRLTALTRRFQPDLVQTYGWASYSAAAAASATGVPLVLSALDYAYVCPKRTLIHRGEICSGPAPVKCLGCAGQFYGPAKGAVATAGVLGMSRFLRTRSTYVHTISEYMLERLGADFDVHADGDPPVRVIPWPRRVAREEVDRSVLDSLPDEPFILYVGALRRVKGVFDLLSAYEGLDEGKPPLVLIGTAEVDMPTSFPKGVSVVLDVPNSTVLEAWDHALFGVFPSRWPEPLGVVVHEAMSRGRAVIGTFPGGHEDMIEDGTSGFLVRAGDTAGLRSAMSRLIADAPLRDAMGTAARESSARFALDAVVPEFERLYFEVLAKASSR
jgi:glycosyltransferase involved in cell wall biosynthesis